MSRLARSSAAVQEESRPSPEAPDARHQLEPQLRTQGMRQYRHKHCDKAPKTFLGNPFKQIAGFCEDLFTELLHTKPCQSLTIEQGVHVDHARPPTSLLLVQTRMADNEQAPVQGIVDRDHQELF